MGRKASGIEKVMISRRLPKDLWERLQAYVDTITPRTTDTAVLEEAIVEYLDKHQDGKAVKK